SGTTHLHNLLTQDPQFGYLTMGHCITADAFLTMPGWINRILAGKMPESRPVDGVAMGWEVPQEEEFALERITELSYNHCYLFPDRAEEIFRRCVTFDAGPQYSLSWMCQYDQLIRRLSFDQEGKTLCLKNPPNTARIKELLAIYPDARFVYIVRHPEQVFRSTRKLWQTVTRMLGLTIAPPEQLEANFLLFYELLLKRYLAERAAIPEGHLIEVKFEDVDQQPVSTLERIYSELNLNGFESAKPRILEYAESLKHFQKNPHRLDPDDLQTVRERWGFAIDEWNYE
ncbi:MAG TPA: sulfotransferase, partial [Planctomycetaceae bacterium]|nr:sulfotransferase [Planctomycetaceae bacterium]